MKLFRTLGSAYCPGPGTPLLNYGLISGLLGVIYDPFCLRDDAALYVPGPGVKDLLKIEDTFDEEPNP